MVRVVRSAANTKLCSTVFFMDELLPSDSNLTACYGYGGFESGVACFACMCTLEP